MVNEDSFLKNILHKLGKENMLQGNEDAIAVELETEKNILVINTDSMSLSSDALPPEISLFDFGKKLVTITVSDVITKGATPKYFLSTITVPKNFTDDQSNGLVAGMLEGCNSYNLSYLGGDLGNSIELVISGIVIGFCKKGSLLKRSNAKENDLVCTTGYFGLTGLGYKHYLEGSSILNDHPEILQRVNKKLSNPRAVIEWVPHLLKYANATIDSSDGLYKSLYHLAQESNKSINLEILPTDPFLVKNLKNYPKILNQCTLFGGEEFEIVFTISRQNLELLQNEVEQGIFKDFLVIGTVKEGKKEVLYKMKPISDFGPVWNSFSGFIS